MITVPDLMSAIQERMTDIGLTQAGLAQKAGLSQPHLSNLFTGKIKQPQLTTALKLCNATGIRVQFIVPKATK